MKENDGSEIHDYDLHALCLCLCLCTCRRLWIVVCLLQIFDVKSEKYQRHTLSLKYIKHSTFNLKLSQTIQFHDIIIIIIIEILPCTLFVFCLRINNNNNKKPRTHFELNSSIIILGHANNSFVMHIKCA